MTENPERRAQADRAQRQDRALSEALKLQAEREGSASRAGEAERHQPPPAGWYRHPSMADTQRYWDGHAWTDHVAPGLPMSSGAPTSIETVPVATPWWTKGRTIAVGATAVISLLIGYSVITALADDGEADVRLIELEIKREVLEQRGLSVSVNCPSQIDWDVGRTFNCVVEAADGTRANAEVTMENDVGDITWRIR